MHSPSRPPEPSTARLRPQPESVRESARLTYEPFYGLREPAFGAAPDPRFFYHSRSHDRAVQEILTAIGRREGIILLTGSVGSGKTLVCRAVVEQLDLHTLTAFVAEPPASVEGLLKAILAEFGVVSRTGLSGSGAPRATRHELRVALREFLRSLDTLPAVAVVFVDDAQNLSVDVLDEVCAITEDEAGKRSVQFVLAGGSALLEALEGRELERFNRLVALRAELGPLAADEITEYIGHRLTVAGAGQAGVRFEPQVFDLLFAFTDGWPRLLNQLCDRSLRLAHVESDRVIGSRLVESAAQDLGLLKPITRKGRALRVILLVFLILLLVGAGAAAWLFREQVGPLVSRWWGG
jgi:general secretion pathway protein A